MSEFNYLVNGNANDFLRNGNEFLESTKRCIGMREDGSITIMDVDGMNTLPAATVVNASFAIEMYLKALLIKANIPFPKNKDGHNINKLFELLPDDTKDSINRFIGFSKDNKPFFEQFTEKHKTDFVDIRYYVENCGWKGMDPLLVYAYAFNLSQITNAIFNSK